MIAQLTLGAGSINQDVPANGARAGWYFAFGARIWADQPSSPAQIVVWAFYADGTTAQVGRIDVVAGPDARPQHLGWFALDRPANTLRWEVYLGAATATTSTTRS